jgi:hypothetical protein
MGKIADALKKLQENPEDLSTLPQLIANVETIEGNETEYQTRIQKLQDINRSYLAQIPIPGNEPENNNEEDTQPTLEDAKQYLVEHLGGKE